MLMLINKYRARISRVNVQLINQLISSLGTDQRGMGVKQQPPPLPKGITTTFQIQSFTTSDLKQKSKQRDVSTMEISSRRRNQILTIHI